MEIIGHIWFEQDIKKMLSAAQSLLNLFLLLCFFWTYYNIEAEPVSFSRVCASCYCTIKMWFLIWLYNGQLYSTNDMVQWTICLGSKRTADISSAVRGDTHTHTHRDTRVRRHTQNHTRAQRVPLSGVQDWKPVLGVCFSVQSTNKWIESLCELFVCLRGLCPCCDIIYECHNWGWVNCRFSLLSDAPCVNTEVQGDGADQYTETGAIPWIYSPVTRGLWNNSAVAFSQLLDKTCRAAGAHLSNMPSSDQSQWRADVFWFFFLSK